jgi:hypothetical protein
MAEEKTTVELVYDAETDSYRIGRDRPRLEDVSYLELSRTTFTEEDLGNIPGTKFTRKNGEAVSAQVDIKSLSKVVKQKLNIPVEEKTEVLDYKELQKLREGEAIPEQQYAYRQGRIVDSKNVNEFLFQDPVTRQLKFITAAAPGADVVGGTAEGGVPNPDFAVITPTGPGSTINVVYDATVVQNDFINKLSRENKVGEFKKLLIEKGYYLLANFGDIQTQESLRQGEVPDEMFGIAFNKFLNEYSIANYDNLKKGINLFQIDDYIKNVQPDYDALSAYVPSERDAEQALKSTYANYVGRLPSAEELSAFKLALESEAKSKPRVTEPDFTTGMQTTYEGFTADQLDAFAEEYTLERPEAQEFGAGQGGLNAISNVFGRIVQKARNEMASAVTPGSL